MNPMEKRILDTVAHVLKKERQHTADLIATALPADHQAIPQLAVAAIKLHKSDIREYCNNLLHRNSKVIETLQVETPFYIRQLDA